MKTKKEKHIDSFKFFCDLCVEDVKASIYQAHSVCLPSNFKVDCFFKVRKLNDEKEQAWMGWHAGFDLKG